MKLQTFFSGLVLVAATAAITSVVVSGPPDTKKAGNATQQPPNMPEMSPEMKEMMQKCTDAGTPGENHKVLNAKVGKWNGVVKMWMMPDSEPQESKCTSEAKWIMNGHYISENVEGTFGEETFLGQSWGGYDNITKKYFWAWIDNMGTGLMTSKGAYDATAKTFKYTTDFSCPMAGKPVAGRSVEKWIDNDHIVMEMYGPWFKTGKEYKMMEITYTRAR